MAIRWEDLSKEEQEKIAKEMSKIAEERKKIDWDYQLWHEEQVRKQQLHQCQKA